MIKDIPSGVPLKSSQLSAGFNLPVEKGKIAKGSSLTQGMGQTRAFEAIKFSAKTPHPDFNLFVLGRPGYGRHKAVLSILKDEALAHPAPSDWVYVNNFETPHKPIAIQLPAGMAGRFKKAMQDLVNDLANDIPALFEAEAYQNKRRAIEQDFGGQHEKSFNDLMQHAQDKDLVLLRTPMGFMLAAQKDGKPMKPDEFNKLPKDQQKQIEQNISEIQTELEAVLKQIPKREKEHRSAVESLNSSVALEGVENALEDVVKEFGDIPKIAEYLEAVKSDIIDNADQFLTLDPEVRAGAFPVSTTQHYKNPQYFMYSVNVILSDQTQVDKGAPVVTEELPTLANLVGRIEHVAEMGALLTNFTMIRPGALHRANGGYLVLDILQVLSEPFAWDALKRCLKTQQIAVVSAHDRLGLVSTISLEPDPIPLSLRVVLVGERALYYLLMAYDADFARLFKIQADFDDEVFISKDSIEHFVGIAQNIAQESELLPLNKGAITNLLTEATRLAEDSEKLSLNIGTLSDIIREADFWAKASSAKSIDGKDIAKAIEQAEKRASRPRELTHEAITRNTLIIDTEGESIGQINALSVHQLGNYRFGRPSRLTARVRMGKGKVVDIEREVELGGPLHSKGVLILSGYLATHYALDVPMSLWASIVFEQSYGGVDGDSASAAELFALLSALSDCAIDQCFAVTGSVNQLGEIQAIGGVNEKIEGFFDICDARGLTGKQGVLIPYANIKHLALRPRVIEAVKKDQFSIIPISTIDEGMELLTGIKSGQRGKAGKFPINSLNNRVETKLIGFAERLKEYAAPKDHKWKKGENVKSEK